MSDMSLARCQLLLPVTLLALLCVCLATPTSVNIENDVLHFSYDLERWLDEKQRPCQNFVAYVCSKSLNNTQTQERQKRQEQENFEKFIATNNDEQLMDVELKLKQFYAACKNARSVEDLKSSFMYRVSGGWPAIDDSTAMIRKRRNTTWMNVLSAFHDVGAEYFFNHRVEIKSNKRVIYLMPNEATHYTLRKFEQLAGEVLDQYLIEPGRARLVALEILSFERSRREIFKTEVAEIERELSYADFKSSLFGRNLQIDWDSYFKRILGKPLKDSDTMIVRELPKLMKSFELLQNTTMTRFLNWIWIDYLMDKSVNDCQYLVQLYFEPVYQHIVQRTTIEKVQMAQMYSDLGRAYDEVLGTTHWIDEMSRQSSKQFQGRVIHLTLNGDAKLDADYKSLTVTKRNYYRNLEKAQKFLTTQLKLQRPTSRVLSNSVDVTQAAADFMKIFMSVNALLQQQNLTAPLNYALVGEHFAECLIASGSSSTTPGAWRSMDSEREFAAFKHCIGRQTSFFANQTITARPATANLNTTTTATAAVNYNFNDLILKMLAQHQTLHALGAWQRKDVALMRRLDNLLMAGRLQLSMRKLYFVGTVLTRCGQYTKAEEKALLNAYLRNSVEFTQAFGCRSGDELYARNICKVL